MAGTLTLLRKVITQETIERVYQFTPNAAAGKGYSQVTKEVLDFTAAVNTNKLPRPRPPAKPLPAATDFQQLQVPGGFGVELRQNTVTPGLTNFLLVFWNGSAELATADYPAGLGGKNVTFSVTTKRRSG